jgi:hypothetical protein
MELLPTTGLGPGARRSGEIADALGVKISSLGPVRAKLIQKGMIFSPAHGDMAFTVPLFDEFMLRAMPQMEKNA